MPKRWFNLIPIPNLHHFPDFSFPHAGFKEVTHQLNCWLISASLRTSIFQKLRIFICFTFFLLCLDCFRFYRWSFSLFLVWLGIIFCRSFQIINHPLSTRRRGNIKYRRTFYPFILSAGTMNWWGSHHITTLTSYIETQIFIDIILHIKARMSHIEMKSLSGFHHSGRFRQTIYLLDILKSLIGIKIEDHQIGYGARDDRDICQWINGKPVIDLFFGWKFMLIFFPSGYARHLTLVNKCFLGYGFLWQRIVWLVIIFILLS